MALCARRWRTQASSKSKSKRKTDPKKDTQRRTRGAPQIYTSPSIRYCAFGSVYCGYELFNGRYFRVAFQLRQHPTSYGIGQETVGATKRGEIIDPYISNDQLELCERPVAPPPAPPRRRHHTPGSSEATALHSRLVVRLVVRLRLSARLLQTRERVACTS